jgi:hypothetical protein
VLALSRAQRAHVLVHNAAIFAGGIGAGWVSELWFIPDSVPLWLLQTAMVLLLLRLFLIRWRNAVLLSAVAALCMVLALRGLSWLGAFWGTGHEVLLDVALAVLGTELLGGLTYRTLFAIRPAAPHSLLGSAVSAVRHGPLRVLVTSLPMLCAGLFIHLSVQAKHIAEIHLRAKTDTTLVPVVIEYPLIERSEPQTLRLSGMSWGGGERVTITIADEGLRQRLEQKLIQRRIARARVVALVPPPPKTEYAVDGAWRGDVALLSDYWDRVRARLYLLGLGLLGSAALLWLGAKRTQKNSLPQGPQGLSGPPGAIASI